MLERKPVISAVLLALAFLAYRPVLANVFGSDDPLFLNNAQNVLAHPSALFTERVLLYFRPLFQLWVTTLYALFGPAPRGWFVAIVLLHALNAFLVWRLALRLLCRPIAALVAAATFAVLFTQSGALMWMAAHASVLVTTFALAMLLSHLDACESGGAWPAVRTALLALAMLLSKESGLFALLWLPLAEWRVRGLRACFDRAALKRYAPLGVATLLYLVANPRVLLEGLAGGLSTTSSGAVSALHYATPSRILAAAGWLASPVEHVARDARPWLGVVALAAPVALAFALSRSRVRDALLFAGLLLSALVSSCSLAALQANGSRMYYLPSVGAALGLGLVVALIEDRVSGRAKTWSLAAVAAGLLAFVAVHVQAIHAKNARDYGPGSLWQQHPERMTDLFHDPDRPEASASPGSDATDGRSSDVDTALLAEVEGRLQARPAFVEHVPELLVEKHVGDATAAAIIERVADARSPAAQQALRTILADVRGSPAIRAAALAALGGLEDPDEATLALLWSTLRERSAPGADVLSNRAALALGRVAGRLAASDPPRAAGLRDGLVEALARSAEAEATAALLLALGRCGDPSIADVVMPRLAATEPVVRTSAAKALGQLGRADTAAPVLAQLQRETTDEVRAALASALAALDGDEGQVLQAACREVAGVADEPSRHELVAWLVRHAAADPVVRARLAELCTEDPSERIRALVAGAVPP